MEKRIQQHLGSKDEVLKKIIPQIPLAPLVSNHQVFHDLMSCIIEQQIHYRSTKKIFQKMLDAADIDLLTLKNFPKFEERGFQNVKLSLKKYETINQVLEFFNQNKVNWQQLDDEAVRKQLSQIKGVGPWTIDMILLYTLERPNIFPADDYHLRLMMMQLYDIDPAASVKAQLKAVAQNWSPYQSFAVRYLLAWKAFQKKGIL